MNGRHLCELCKKFYPIPSINCTKSNLLKSMDIELKVETIVVKCEEYVFKPTEGDTIFH